MGERRVEPASGMRQEWKGQLLGKVGGTTGEGGKVGEDILGRCARKAHLWEKAGQVASKDWGKVPEVQKG